MPCQCLVSVEDWEISKIHKNNVINLDFRKPNTTGDQAPWMLTVDSPPHQEDIRARGKAQLAIREKELAKEFM